MDTHFHSFQLCRCGRFLLALLTRAGRLGWRSRLLLLLRSYTLAYFDNRFLLALLTRAGRLLLLLLRSYAWAYFDNRFLLALLTRAGRLGWRPRPLLSLRSYTWAYFDNH